MHFMNLTFRMLVNMYIFRSITVKIREAIKIA